MLSQFATAIPSLQFSFIIPSMESHEIDGVARGLGAYFQGSCIVGEGIGIGAPLALKGNRAVFPLDSEILRSGKKPIKRFYLNSLSQKYVGGLRADFPYKWLRSHLALLYLKSPAFRPVFNYLMAARTAIGIKSHYEKLADCGHVDITYEAEGSEVHVNVDASNLEADRFLVGNELDGRLFTDLLVDDSLRIDRVPPWLEIKGRTAQLLAPKLGLAFTVETQPGCRLFCGREVLGQRLNWAGFSYSPNTGKGRFNYKVVFERNA